MRKNEYVWSTFDLNKKSDKIKAMDAVLNFTNKIHWTKADNIHYPNFIVDVWNNEKDHYFNLFLDANCSIPAFYHALSTDDKINLLNYISDTYLKSSQA